MARFIVRWPTSASLGMALLALVLVLGGAIRLRAWGVGLGASLASVIAALLASLAVGFLLGALKAVPVPWVAHPMPALLALHGASIAAGVAVARLIGRRSTPQALWAGTWLTWGVIGVAVAVVAPGACFLFVVPALVAGFFGWLRVDVASTIPAVAAAVLWLPIAILVYDGLGLILPAVACISSTLLVSTLPPLVGKRVAGDQVTGDQVAGDQVKTRVRALRITRAIRIAVPSAIASLVVLAALLPKYSIAQPQRVNVVFRQDTPADGPAPAARIYVEAAWAYHPWGTPPGAMVSALGDPARVQSGPPSPWSAIVPFAEVPRVDLAPPSAELVSSAASSAGRSLRVRLRSARGAPTLAIVLPVDRFVSVSVEGQPAAPRHGAVAFRGVPPEGVEIIMIVGGTSPVDVTILDTSPGVPNAARGVRDARPAEATQTQEGDTTIVSRHVAL